MSRKVSSKFDLTTSVLQNVLFSADDFDHEKIENKELVKVNEMLKFRL